MNIRWVGAKKTVYDTVGGRVWFEKLVEHFYRNVESDPVIRGLYPKDLTLAKKNTTEFLIQYWGGPADYSTNRGHPRLRMRHAPFAIGTKERDAWMDDMREAVNAMNPTTEIKEAMLDYFEMASTHMINTEM
jgi:hemoglobin